MTRHGEFVKAVLSSLDLEGISHVVLRNYEDLPDRIGNDLDLLVTPTRHREAENVIVAAADSAGWRLLNRVHHVPTGLYFSREGGSAGLHVDLFHGLWWRGFEILPAGPFLATARRIGPHAIPDPKLEDALVLLSGLLYAGHVRDRYRRRLESAARADTGDFEARLAGAAGSRLAARMIGRTREGDWDGLHRLAGRLRRAVVLRSLSNPIATSRRIAGETVRLIRRFRSPPGFMVVLLGTDGSGKTTIARELSDRLRWLFPVERLRLIHWRPTIAAPGEGPGVPVTDPHGREPRPVVLSAVFLAYHWVRFVAGSWLGLQPTLFRNGLVLADRYYQDFYVDPRRYRLRVAPGLLRLFDRGFRKPDLTLVLDVDPDIALERKQEVSFEELVRQREAYRELARRSAGEIIDASGLVEEVVHVAIERIERHLEQRAIDR